MANKTQLPHKTNKHKLGRRKGGPKRIIQS